MQSQRLGELLRGRGLVSDRELADALALQSLAGGLLGQLLIRTGALSEVELLAVRSAELGLPVLAGEAPNAAAVARLFFDRKGRLIHKGPNYLPTYERYFATLPRRPPTTA